MVRWLLGLVVIAGCVEKESGVGDDGDESDSEAGDEDVDDVVGDPCSSEGEMLSCEITDPWLGEGDGTRYCARSSSAGLRWSECAEDHECRPKETISCSDPSGASSTLECTMSYDGRLSLMCPPTPLAIDLGGDGFAFEPAAGRAFDIAGDPSCIDVDWPVRSTAWLAIDRDGDGAIANGRELFGSGTPMPDRSRPRDGFVALATLDDDLDGAITPHDAAFPRILLWSDTDDDRRGTGDELLSLAQVGIASLPLTYDRDRECDARGNCIVERASVTTHAGTRPLVDLHLACQ